jgi:excisionase family DNA binding protein
MQIAVQLGEEDRQAIAMQVAKILTPMITRTNKHSNEDRLFDVPSLAEYLGVSKDWVYKQVAQQGIPHVKTDRLVRFRKSAIDRWLEDRTVKSLSRNPADKYLRKDNGAGDV